MFQAFLPAKIRGSKNVGEIVIWMAGVQRCDEVRKGSATGGLTEGAERT